MKKLVNRCFFVCFLICVFNASRFADAKTIYWISDAQDSDLDGVPSDQSWVDFLEDAGYSVNYEYGDQMVAGQGYWTLLDLDVIDDLETADLIIISRCTDSGQYANDEVEILDWNSITKPILMLTAYISRSSRWQWFNTGATLNAVDTMQVIEPDHYIFNNVPMFEENKIAVLDTGFSSSVTSFPVTNDAGYGILLAARADTGGVWITEWDEGVEFYEYTDQVPAGKRMFFALGEAGDSNSPEIGYKNTTEAGDLLFMNTVKYMLGDTLESAVESHISTLKSFALLQNYPNPFNPTTTIQYELKENGPATLTIFDVTGREIAKLFNSYQPAGVYQIDFDAADLESGIYFYKLSTPTESKTRKMTLVR